VKDVIHGSILFLLEIGVGFWLFYGTITWVCCEHVLWGDVFHLLWSQPFVILKVTLHGIHVYKSCCFRT